MRRFRNASILTGVAGPQWPHGFVCVAAARYAGAGSMTTGTAIRGLIFNHSRCVRAFRLGERRALQATSIAMRWQA